MFPAELILSHIEAIDNGQSPEISLLDYFRLLHLDSAEPDQLTLRQRLNLDYPQNKEPIDENILALLHDSVEVVVADKNASPQEKAFVTGILVPILVAQISREGNVCEDTRVMLSQLSTRPGLLPEGTMDFLRNR